MENEIETKILQYLSLNCVAYEEVLLGYYRSLLTDNSKEVNITEIIRSLNDRLDPLGIKISKCRSEVDGSWFFGIVNEFVDQSYKKNAHISLQSFKIFFSLLNILIRSDGHVKSYTLHDLNDLEFNNCSSEILHHSLNELVYYGYIKEYENGYTVGDKALLDLKHKLSDFFHNEIPICDLCKDIVILNIKCIKCGKKMHKHCCEKINKLGNILCLSCAGSDLKIVS